MTQSRFLRALGLAAASALALSACAPYQETRTETVTTTRVVTADNPDAVFNALDTNRDGFLSRGELDVLMGAAPYGPPESPEMVFRRLDVKLRWRIVDLVQTLSEVGR